MLFFNSCFEQIYRVKKCLKKRRTKIVSTLGPATDRPGVLEGIIKAGANVVRINFSHGAFEDHKRRVEAVREISHRLGLSRCNYGRFTGTEDPYRRF